MLSSNAKHWRTKKSSSGGYVVVPPSLFAHPSWFYNHLFFGCSTSPWTAALRTVFPRVTAPPPANVSPPAIASRATDYPPTFVPRHTVPSPSVSLRATGLPPATIFPPTVISRATDPPPIDVLRTTDFSPANVPSPHRSSTSRCSPPCNRSSTSCRFLHFLKIIMFSVFHLEL